MNKEELYKKALTNVHRYSLLNEIFAIRDNRYPNETTDYTIMVNGYISLDVLNRYVKNIDELIKYQNIDTIKNLEQLQQENKQLKKELEKADSITQSCIVQGKEKSELSFRNCLNKMTDYKIRIDKAIGIFEKCRDTNDFSTCDIEMYEILKGDK